MENKKPHQPFDRLFKAVFSNKEMAVEYIEQFLPKELTKQLHLKEMKLEETSYLSAKLARFYSDIVYKCSFGKSNQKVKVCLLFEHKSDPDDFVYLQLLEYMSLIWRRQKNTKNTVLTPILPVVFYHGDKGWSVRTFADMFGEKNQELDHQLFPFLPNFEFLFTDLSKYPNEQLLQLKQRFLKNSFLALKHAWDKKYLKEHFGILLTINNNYYQKQMFVFLSKIVDIEEIELDKALDGIDEKNKNNIMTLYDRLMNKGREEGLEKGLETGLEKGFEKGKHNTLVHNIRNMHKNKMSVEEIAKILEVEEAFVAGVISGEIKEME